MQPMPARPPHPSPPQGLPSREQILDFIQTADSQAGKREISRHFGVQGQERIALKHLLRDMADEGLIDGGRSAYHRLGGVAKVTVLQVVDVEDGEAIAIPAAWQPDDAVPPPRLRVVEGRRGALRSALGVGDRVLARTEETGEGATRSWRAFPMKLLPAAEQAILGVVELDGAGKPWLAPVDKRVRHSSPVADLGGAEAGQLVLAEPAGRSPRAGVKVIEVLGDPLLPRAYSLIAIHKHGIPNVFTQGTLDEAERAAKLPLAADAREDLTHLPIVAIDPADARDHDDAIWARPSADPANAGGFDAVVAIADVAFYVRPGSEVDREARKRGNSVYFPDRVVPMLPEVLSADVCSLRAGEPRAAMACRLTIDAQGRVTAWRFTRAIVRINEVIAYEDAQARIDGHEGAGDAGEPLRQLWAAWHLLNAARTARDPLELDLPERRVQLDEQGRIAAITVRERLDAHRVVEDFMIAANVAAAKALESKASPVVYRVHEPPTREKLVALRDYFDSIGKKLALGQVVTPGLFNRMMKDIADPGERALVMEAVLRSQTQAYYGPANAGHFGLALGSYAHFTSPIRRYADLLVHRALVDAFQLEQPAPDRRADLPAKSGLSDQDRADLAKITEIISMTERRAMEAERDTIDRYVAAWLSARVGETFPTRITGVQKFGFFATIVGLGGDGLVPVSSLGREYFTYDDAAHALTGDETGTRFTVGDLVDLRLAEANPLTGALKFEVLDGDGAAVVPRGARPEPKDRRRGGPRKDGQGRDAAGKHAVDPRGRPGNLRHQGRGKRK